MAARKLNTRDLDALHRSFWAERFTSPSTKPIATPRTYLKLQKEGLLEWRNGSRLTNAGRAALKAALESGALIAVAGGEIISAVRAGLERGT